ncbi:RNA-binding domain-containing protein [Flavobacterium ginsengiterrae]|uniref:Schlafen AlbA-2 domain-containing protein n=1 Tax=Flavobacterium ginsengiterrae TaxID=871695 RepID=A0ABP7GEG4_9FLAO
MSLLINIEDLLSGTIVEGTRMEFKQGWNPTPIMRTVCAFANDFENEGSGYIIVGVEEKDGRPVRPVLGFDPNLFETVQKEMINYCNQIQPTYFPVLSLEEIDGKHVLVIWVSAGTNRPYKVPDDVLSRTKTYHYRIRQYSSTIVPSQEQELELIQLTAKIPFDDRVNQQAKTSDLSFALMREHLEKTKSRLFDESARMSVEELAQQMNLSQGANEHLFPKNVGLLMFSSTPQKYFKGAKIDLVEFPEGVDGKNFNEITFEGTIQQQLIDVLSYFKSNIIKEKIIKFSDREQSDRVYNYPYEAIEEALSNAVYHRNYELQDPIEVRILPDAIEIISYSGADPALKQRDFTRGIVRARRYRNRRIGEFLKELRLTEGRATGIPTINRALRENGSPKPKFDTDEPDRRYFIIEIPIHPAFTIDSDTLEEKATPQAIKILEYCKEPKSRAEILDYIGITNQTKNFNTNVLPLLEQDLIEYTIKESPKDRNQKYIITEKGNLLLSSLKKDNQ